jgi:hypothetical protein
LALKLVDPSINKNFLISCWNTTIKANIPTPKNPPRILLSSYIYNKSVSHHIP